MPFPLDKLRTINEKWLLVEQLRSGQLWKDRLARAGVSQLNLHVKTFRSLAHELAGPWLAASNCVLVGRAAISMLVQHAHAELNAQNKLQYFVTGSPGSTGLAESLTSTLQDLRLAGIDPLQISEAACEVPAKANDLKLIYEYVAQRQRECGWVDYAFCLQQSLSGLANGEIRLPPSLCIIRPEPFTCSWLESQLLEKLVAVGADYYAEPELIVMRSHTPRISIQPAVGAINEVRHVLQSIIHHPDGPLSFDKVEIAYTDYDRYVPLIMESLTGISLQLDSEAAMTNEENSANQTSVASYATFAEGIACTYSRPGRLLRSWVRWMRSGCHQSQAVEIMREGLLSRPGSAETYGYGRLASTLRRIPIGFGVERYLQNVDLAITEARQQLEDYTSELRQEQRPRDFGIGALEALKLTLQPVIELTIQACQDPSQLLRAARTLMAEHARADSQLDRQARARLLDDIDMMLQLIEHDQLNSLHVEQWLEGLPTSSRMFAQSPQPGNLFVTSWDQCGLSGREHIFVLGLNDGLAPKPARMDPILLDGERGQLSTYLPTSSQRRQDQQAIFERINARWLQIANAQITLSYALRDFTDDSQLSPSMFLSAYDDQAEHAVAFLPVEADTLLDQEEVFWLRLLTAHDTGQRRKVVCERYGYLHQRDIAQTAQQEDAFTAYDGFVPRAGEDAVAQWNTTVFSPSRLEVLGTCPRKYFFQRCLGVRPPDQWDVDLDRWLSPLEIGSLLHALFEEFVGGLIDKKQLPTFSRDWPRLVSLLDRLLAEKAKQYPPPGVQTLADARDELLTTCEIFLKAEEAYTLQRQAKPMWLEVALGTEADPSNATASPLITERPVAITLGNGQVIQLVGRVDRIDALASKSPQYLVWDYKSGSNYAYAQDKPFDQGRQLQPLLYVRMLQARLQQLKMRGEVSGFGYFFPSAKSEGLRMEWNSAELMAGDSILCALLELLTSGTFIATDRKDDCTMCEFQRVCGPPENLVYLTNLKMDAAANAQLAAWRKLRGMAV